MRIYRDRADAGRELAESIRAAGFTQPIVLGIPRGGVVVAAEIARLLQGQLGVVVARKLGAPFQAELAIGAITADGSAYVDHELAREVGADERYLEAEKARQATEARRREEAFDGEHRPAVAGRTVVIVDDGVATGSTAIAAVRAMRAAGAGRVVLAIPVAHPRAVRILEQEADDVICPQVDPHLYAVGQYYSDFRQTEDAEVRRILEESRPTGRQPRRVEATVSRDGVRIAAVLSEPPGDGPFACVLFVHGLGSGKDSPRNVVVSEALLDAGVATILFDLSGHGESDRDPSGSAAFPRDLEAVWRWATTQPRIVAGRIGIAGSSLGATTAIEALRANAVAPAALVLRAPPVEPGMLESISLPTLIVIGSEDPLLEEVRGAVPAGGIVRVEEVAGAGHLFEEPGALEEATRLTVDWFVRHLS